MCQPTGNTYERIKTSGSGAVVSAGERGVVPAVGTRLAQIAQLQRTTEAIEDPFHLGAHVTLLLAIFAEVLCPLLILAGVLVRLACLPILAVLLIAMVVVHPEWTLFEGQFGWLLLILFTSVLIAGPGRFVLGQRFA